MNLYILKVFESLYATSIISHNSTIPVIAGDDFRSLQVIHINHILGTKEQLWIDEVLIKLSGLREVSGYQTSGAVMPVNQLTCQS